MRYVTISGAKRPRRLEILAGNVLLPPFATAYIGQEVSQQSKELSELSRQYVEILDGYAFDRPKDYTGFREFLNIFQRLFTTGSFGDLYPRLRKMTEVEIDYVLSRVREERAVFLLDSVDEG